MVLVGYPGPLDMLVFAPLVRMSRRWLVFDPLVTLTDTDAVLGVLPLFHSLAQMANLLLPLTGGARVVFLQSVSSTALLEALQQRGITIFACVPQFFYLIHQRVVDLEHRLAAGEHRVATVPFLDLGDDLVDRHVAALHQHFRQRE